MKLSKITEVFPNVTVLREAEFEKMGLTVHGQLPSMLTFVRSEAYIEQALNLENVSAIITTHEIGKKIMTSAGVGVAVCDRPELTFFLFHNHLVKETDFYERPSFPTRIGKNCRIATGAMIAEQNVVIGDGTEIGNGTVIEEHVTIGKKCFIGPNTVIGSRGFQYCRDNGKGIYVEHIAGVILEDNVDVFPGCCIATGLFVPTILKSEVKLDNLVHVAHSVCIDNSATLPAGVIFGGGVHVGKNAWIGLNATVRQMTNVGDNATVCMGAVVTRDVENGATVSGNLAIDHKKTLAHIKRIMNDE